MVDGSSPTRATPFADTLVDAFPFLVVGLVASIPLLLVPSSWSVTGRFVAHLSAVVGLGLLVAIKLAPRLDEVFFRGRGWTARRAALGTAVVLVVVVTGVIALVTLASAAALRFDPSLQFLQLISALDIAWASAAIVIGGHHLWGRATGTAAGVVLGVLCVFSIWNYLRVVGYTPTEGWRVDGSRLNTLVLPFDMAAAVAAIAVLVLAVRKLSTNRAGE